ncbi:MAG: hypothetical protein EA419_08010 [Wenzhouxiangella sp.]|nr:MAG: hypothetical protein EA419_08010 [Wenzhouxiangella sp.]
MITVLIPDLDFLLDESRQAPALLGVMMARASSRALDPANYQSRLLTGQDISAAAVSRMRDAPDDARGVWMRADPVSLVPDLNAVWIRTEGRLDRSSPLFGELVERFAEDGLDFDLPVPERGYLRLDRVPDCRFQPPWALAGQSLDHVLPEGPDARFWRRLLSDCQVLLHHHRQLGQADADALWFWGPGSLPPRDQVRARVSHVASLDPDLLTLADWLALSHEPVDAPARPADASLVTWSADPEVSAEANLQRLAAWLAPLWRRLRWGRIGMLELASRSRAWQLTPACAWQFWRRRAAAAA